MMTNNNVIVLEDWKRGAATVYDCMWTADELRVLAGSDHAKSVDTAARAGRRVAGSVCEADSSQTDGPED